MAIRSAFHTRVDMFTHHLVFDINLGLFVSSFMVILHNAKARQIVGMYILLLCVIGFTRHHCHYHLHCDSTMDRLQSTLLLPPEPVLRHNPIHHAFAILQP